MKKPVITRFVSLATVLAVTLGMVFGVYAQTALPTPDFSEFEKSYEVVHWEYDSGKGKITMVVKAKKDPPHKREFRFKYFDNDGIDPFIGNVGAYEPFIRVAWDSPAGQVERVEIDAPDEADLRKFTQVIVYRVLEDGTLVGPKPEESKPAEGVKDAPPTKEDKPKTEKPKTGAAKKPQPTEGCSFPKYPAPANTAKFSDAVIKGLIYQSFAFEVETGGLTSPLAVGVDFVSIKHGAPYTNTVKVVPGRGAQRRNDAAPVNAKIYTFHTIYIVCRKYRDSITRTQYDSDYDCFINKDGGWVCGVSGGVPKITHLK